MHPESHPHGLRHDLEALASLDLKRRQALRWLSALAAPLAGCGGGGGEAASATSSAASTALAATTTTSTGATSTASGTCSTIPTETAGPYPGDGTNSVGGTTVNALTLSGIVRSDIRSSFAGATGVADGIALTVKLALVNTNASCASLAGLAVYLWHCDALGRYSLYSSGVTGENYLRGVQVSDSSGEVTFTTIVPGCYSGRWPHIHFEVYTSAAAATRGTNANKITQLALPQAACSAAYADSRYTGSAANLASVSLASDGIFSDGSSTQLATVTGSNAAGYVATLQVGVAV